MSLDLEHHLVIVRTCAFVVPVPAYHCLLTSAKYGAYHHNKVNITIHLICVPVIMISAFTMVCLSLSQS